MTFKGMNEPKSPKSQLERGPRFKPAALDVLLVACAGLTLWFILPLLAMAWVSDTSQSQTPLAAAQSLESKIRVLSEPESAGPSSFQPIVVTENEINAYLKCHGLEFLPPGVRDPAIRITSDRVLGSANVDFGEFGRTASNPADLGPKVLAAMFKGPQRVAASGRIQTQNGQASLKIESVVVGTTTVPDWLVDLLLENYLQPRYNFDLSKPIALPDHVIRVKLDNGEATFVRSPDKKTGFRIPEPGLRMQPAKGGN
jgi:hypothetical protein